jgi:hypothetical protein
VFLQVAVVSERRFAATARIPSSYNQMQQALTSGPDKEVLCVSL